MMSKTRKNRMQKMQCGKWTVWWCLRGSSGETTLCTTDTGAVGGGPEVKRKAENEAVEAKTRERSDLVQRIGMGGTGRFIIAISPLGKAEEKQEDAEKKQTA